MSVGFFLLGGFIIDEDKLHYFGSGLFLARGGALAILVLLVLCILCISRDLLTLLRLWACCGSHCSAFINDHLLFHKVSGTLIVFYSFIHTIGHLYGTLYVMANEPDLSTLNTYLTNGLDRHMSYWELLFASLPGISGVILILSITLLYILSIPCIRDKKWEIFSYSHLLYYLFIVGIGVHGWGGWFTQGWPPSIIVTLLCVGLLAA